MPGKEYSLPTPGGEDISLRTVAAQAEQVVRRGDRQARSHYGTFTEGVILLGKLHEKESDAAIEYEQLRLDRIATAVTNATDQKSLLSLWLPKHPIPNNHEETVRQVIEEDYVKHSKVKEVKPGEVYVTKKLIRFRHDDNDGTHGSQRTGGKVIDIDLYPGDHTVG